MNIYQLFTLVLEVQPNDETLAELPVISECGEDCSKAIYTARAFMECSDDAVHEDIVAAANRAVEIYWRG